jgi:hypothetical protein
MEAGGVAAMEVVARDLKTLGLYTARALSFDGVEYDVLEHALTPAQIEIYDAYAGAFRTLCAAAHNVRNREDAIMRRYPRFIFVFLGFWMSARPLLRIILIANLGGFPTV